MSSGRGARPRSWVSSPAYDALTRMLVDARKRAGLTQRDVAARLNKTPSYVAKIETKEQRVDLIELVAFLRAVDADVIGLVERLIGQLIDSDQGAESPPSKTRHDAES